MSGYLQRKGLIEPLCLSLVNADQDRKGFLDKRTIGQVVGYNGMKISNKQLVLLTQVLVMNQDQDHSYVEMIALLAGEQKMYQIVRDNHIPFGEKQEEEKKIDMSLLQLSQSMLDQLELKYGALQMQVN